MQIITAQMVTTLKIEARDLRKSQLVKVYIGLFTGKFFHINSTKCLKFYLRGSPVKCLSSMMEILGLTPTPREV